ncbi:MAG: Serine/threonine protein kinase [candidate division WS6 bacterium 34_10]|uniref:Serine/threonine protein kinase n=1 Tax=candidate division WS6 bacterium 34_10 TaxID=1641389 RepID=A0A117LZY4_9BACT|nr:MAG: Serine/threonine protein kinase [candidate division WS6 bacterium 34_10]
MGIFENILDKCSNSKIIAEGGQKKVLCASHPDYGQVVIKYGDYRYMTSLERIQREVDLLREIDSDYYPKNFEFLIDTKRRQFIIIEEFVDGKELSLVKDRFSRDEDILVFLNRLLCALNVLWERRVVHRDLKPANILITSLNEPRIVDLGIARELDKTSLTATLAASGPHTPIYAAPEQIENKKTMIDIRTDFFLIGLLMLELVNGFHPFDPTYVGNQNSIIENILNGIYVKPTSGHNEKLIGFIEKSLQLKPYKRFRSLKSILNYLEMEC